MEKKIWIIGVIVLALLIIGGIYISYNKKSPRVQTYDECVQQILKDVRKYKLASEEPIGAIRKDSEGIIWKKISIDSWETDAEEYNSGGGKTLWGNGLIDGQIGGAKYTPESFPECKKYIFTNNIEMEQEFTEIVNKVIQEQSQKGTVISVKEIEVLNLAGKVQGFIDLECSDIKSEKESEIIGSIANRLFVKYPNDFAEGSERDSWVDVRCAYRLGWGISDGYYGRKE